jgi:branched-chain amino acid aminotransferase
MGTISIRQIEKSGLEAVDLNNLDFGQVFCDHMLIAKYENGKWGESEIMPYGPLSLSPAASVLHYGQAVFEGMKAYRTVDGQIKFFRKNDNFERLNLSAKRMCMPEVPFELFSEGLHALVNLDQAWIPPHRESALYLRPYIIAVDEFIGVKPAENYLFIVVSCAVNAYYSKPLRIKIETDFVRAVKGGVGEAKAAGNYAASLYPTRLANQAGFDQLLWTDAKEHKWLEELGTSNFFCVIDNVIITPSTEGAILKGVTRDSVMELARHLGYQVEERRISIDELISAAESGKLSEAFATGTAAALTPIQSITYQGKTHELSVDGVVRNPLFDALLKLRIGESEDPFGWMENLHSLQEG